MTANNDFLSRLLEYASAPSAADALRAPALAELRRHGLPDSKKIEAFKYTPITAYYRSDLLTSDTAAAPRIEFAGGRTPAGVTITQTTAAAIPAESHPLARINASLIDSVTVVDVAAGRTVKETLHIDHASSGCNRVIVRMGGKSRMQIVERHARVDRASNRVIQISLAADARLYHQRTEYEPGEQSAWGLLHATLGDGAVYDLDHYLCGSKPRRADIVVDLRGRAASTSLTAGIIASQAHAIDSYVTINHFGRDTRSRQLVHGIATDKGQLTFNGRIEIHPSAGGSDAQLTNRNLLLMPTARINTKPELEIHTRDVACSHGATVGALDAGQLFYLRSRGIDEHAARSLLTRAFLSRIVTEAAMQLGVETAMQSILEL